ncbi:MAG: LysR family transcriptional regulator [Rhodospirillales bacterium]|nr:LysR family transcriptional regulator [Rhodospirillales bacterium]
MGSYAGAARQLAVDETTVARRLRALEHDLGTELLLREADGRPRLSPTGRAITAEAESMERSGDVIAETIGAAAEAARGIVRLTAVPVVANRILVPALGNLTTRYPGLTIELVPEPSDLSLTLRECDLAVRLARPRDGGTRVTARRIGTLHYGVYGRHDRTAEASLPWITYDAAMASLPPSRWLAKRIADGDAACSLRVTDADTALEAAAQGLGLTLLPKAAAEADARLGALDSNGWPDPPQREVWLLGHADRRALKSIRAVAEWLEGLPAFCPD